MAREVDQVFCHDRDSGTRRDSLRLEGRLKQSLQEHREIIEALRAKDAAGARQAMHDHLLSGRAALARLASAN